MISIIAAIIHYLCYVVFYGALALIGIFLGKKYRIYKNEKNKIEKESEK